MSTARSVTLAAVAARTWSRAYTSGLPAESARQRRDEIASDVWEQAEWSATSGRHPHRTAAHILARTVLGVPADLSWRMHRGGIEVTVNPEKTFVAMVVLLAVYQGAIALMASAFGLGVVTPSEGNDGQGWMVTLSMSAVGLALILLGLRQRASSPMRAGVLIAAGVVPSILWFWMVVPPAIALVVAVYAVFDGRKHQRMLEVAG